MPVVEGKCFLFRFLPMRAIFASLSPGEFNSGIAGSVQFAIGSMRLLLLLMTWMVLPEIVLRCPVQLAMRLVLELLMRF